MVGKLINEQWNIYKIDPSGVLSWDNVEWNVKITNYEPVFGVSLDGDEYVGFNENNLEPIQTDTIGVKLQRDKSSGSLYILDGETRKLITDQYGWEPQLEYSNPGY